MKLVAVALIVAGLLCNSSLAMAEGPVPFHALMQPAGTDAGIPPLDDSKDQSTAGSTQPAHKLPMTSGGKTMTGIGAGLMVIGVVVVIGTALLHDFGPSGKVAAGYAAGGGAIVGGATLIIFGGHRRQAK